jgi:hypothetical protein
MPDSSQRQIMQLGMLDPDVRRTDPSGWFEPFRYQLPSDMEALADATPGLPEGVRRDVLAAASRGRAAIELDAKLRHIEVTYLLYDRATELREDLEGFGRIMTNVRVPDVAGSVTAAEARRTVTETYDALQMIRNRIDQLGKDIQWNEGMKEDPEKKLAAILQRYSLPRPDFLRGDTPSLRTTTDRPMSPARIDMAGLQKVFNMTYEDFERTEEHVTKLEDREKRMRGGQQRADAEIAQRYGIR